MVVIENVSCGLLQREHSTKVGVAGSLPAGPNTGSHAHVSENQLAEVLPRLLGACPRRR